MAKIKFGIIWSRRANLQIRKIRENIAADYSQSRADKYIDGLVGKIEKIKENPERHPPYRNRKLKKAGARVTYRKQYKIVYFLKKMNVLILSVSGARRNPKNLDDLI